LRVLAILVGRLQNFQRSSGICEREFARALALFAQNVGGRGSRRASPKAVEALAVAPFARNQHFAET
tara:strand:+ start:9167 stop:9367 length:201 start_codon:yes stop_codon:yes gene_type:complete